MHCFIAEVHYVIQISVAGKKKIMKGEIYDWFEICLIHQLFLSFIIINKSFKFFLTALLIIESQKHFFIIIICNHHDVSKFCKKYMYRYEI